mmetsp:Transcript_4924/g.10767  ORF Transcript_4924/g.10767 Transcript_4924/m.10767 type:complete len:578 (+) Transcript_4924:212-1945(+)
MPWICSPQQVGTSGGVIHHVTPRGIRFISVQHEQNSAHMADGFARVSGKHGVVIGQNGPGVTNSLTGILAANYAHSPVLFVTPDSSSTTKGLGGFQECNQLGLFEKAVKHQVQVHHPHRMAELTARALDLAMNDNGPTQLNIPRDYFYGEAPHTIHGPRTFEPAAGGPVSLDAAFDLLRTAKNPVLLCGGGVVLSEGVPAAVAFAERLQIPVATTYLHNDAFPKSHPLYLGPLGYLGWKGAMKAVSEADLVLAVGSRLNPFGTLPQYGFDYWPQNATLVQVDVDPKRLSLTKSADVEVLGDARLFLEEMTRRIDTTEVACLASSSQRVARAAHVKSEWAAELAAMTLTQDKVHPSKPGFLKPRAVLSELEKVMPADAVVSTDIGNICSVANSYLHFDAGRHFLAPMTFGNCGYSSPAVMGAKVARPDKPCIGYSGDGAWGMQMMDLLTSVREHIPFTQVVFNNGQWGAEKKNQVLWFGDRYVGTNLKNPSFADVASAMGARGVRVEALDQVGPALSEAISAQMKDGQTTVLEVMCTKELGDPFRRDAMKLPRRHLAKYKGTEEFDESATGQPVDPRE